MLALLSASSAVCPDLSSSTVQLDLTEFVRASWYVQEQQIAPYQAAESLYCVAATYDLEGASVPFYWGTVISVYNQNNNGRVGGSPNFTPPDRITPLCARDDDAANGKLKVAPCFLPNFLTGPYWVIGLTSASDGTYTGAAIIGGNPSVELSDGCTTPEEDVGGLVGGGTGLWIFARGAPPPATLPTPPSRAAVLWSLHRVLVWLLPPPSHVSVTHLPSFGRRPRRVAVNRCGPEGADHAPRCRHLAPDARRPGAKRTGLTRYTRTRATTPLASPLLHLSEVGPPAATPHHTASTPQLHLAYRPPPSSPIHRPIAPTTVTSSSHVTTRHRLRCRRPRRPSAWAGAGAGVGCGTGPTDGTSAG
eukprot:690053-Prymnesium_polylepis.1